MPITVERAKALYEHHLHGRRSKWEDYDHVRVPNHLPTDRGVPIPWDQVRSRVVVPPVIELEYVVFYRKLFRNAEGKYTMVIFVQGDDTEIASEPTVPWWEEGPYKK